MGKRVLDDPRNRLVSEFARIISEVKPKYFVFENVKGLTVGKHKQLLDELIEHFTGYGYQTVAPYQVLNAAHFGVPQPSEPPGSTPAKAHLKFWAAANRHTIQTGRALLGDRFHLLRYDDLCADPQTHVRALSEFLERPLDRAQEQALIDKVAPITNGRYRLAAPGTFDSADKALVRSFGFSVS